MASSPELPTTGGHRGLERCAPRARSKDFSWWWNRDPTGRALHCTAHLATWMGARGCCPRLPSPGGSKQMQGPLNSAVSPVVHPGSPGQARYRTCILLNMLDLSGGPCRGCAWAIALRSSICARLFRASAARDWPPRFNCWGGTTDVNGPLGAPEERPFRCGPCCGAGRGRKAKATGHRKKCGHREGREMRMGESSDSWTE